MKSYETLHAMARKNIVFNSKINGMGVVQGELRINGSDVTAEERADKMTNIRDGGQFDGICRFSVARPRFEDAE